MYYKKNERGFFVPFILGGLFGGALGSTFNQKPVNNGFNPYMPAYTNSYSYYVPQYVPNPAFNSNLLPK